MDPLGAAAMAAGVTPAVLSSDAGFKKFDAALSHFLSHLKESGEVDLQRRFSILANYINSYFLVGDALNVAAGALTSINRIVAPHHQDQSGGDDDDDDGEAAIAAEQLSNIRTSAPGILISVFSILKAWSTLCEAHHEGCSLPSPATAAAAAAHRPKIADPRVVARDVSCGLVSMIYERDANVPSGEAWFEEWRALLSPVFDVASSHRLCQEEEVAATNNIRSDSPKRSPLLDGGGGGVHMKSSRDPMLERPPLEEIKSLLERKSPAAFELTDIKARALVLERRAKVTARALQRSLILEERKRQQWERLMLKEAFDSWRLRVKIDKFLRGQQDDRELTIQRLTISNDDKAKQIKRLQERLLELSRAFDRESHDMRKQLEIEKENGLVLSKKVRELMDSVERMNDKCDESAARILFITSENERYQEKLRMYFHASRGDEKALEEVRRMSSTSDAGGVGAETVKHVQEAGPLYFNPLSHGPQQNASDDEHTASSIVESLLELVDNVAEALAPVPQAAYSQAPVGALDESAVVKLADFHELLLHVVDAMKSGGGGGGSTTPMQPRTPVDEQLQVPRPPRRKGGATPDLLGRSRSPMMPTNSRSSMHSVTPCTVSFPPPEAQIPLWVQLFASTLLANAPNCFQMAMLLNQQAAAGASQRSSRQRSSSATSSIASSRAGSLITGGAAPPPMPITPGGKIPLDAVLDIASTVSSELAVVPNGVSSDFCVPRVEAPVVAHARAKVLSALERAKALEAVRAQFICDLIVEERKAKGAAR